MPLENIIERTADISLVEWQTEPVVMMNDDITFVFTIQKDGLAYPLTNVTKATLACTRRDGKTIVTSGSPDVATGKVTFDIGRKETAVDGRTQMVIQLYDDLQNRVSTIRGTMYVQLDPTGDTYSPLTEELTLIEEVLYDAPPIIEAAQTATLGAIQAKDEANASVLDIVGKQAEVELFLIDSDAAFTQSQSGRANAFVDEQDVRSDVFNQSQFDREQSFDTFEATKETEFQTFKTAKNSEVQTVIGTANTKIAEVVKVTADNKIIPLQTVATIALRNSTYPNPQHGSVVIVSQGVNPLDAETYRFVTGTGWVLIERTNATTTGNLTAQLADMDAQKASKTELANVLDGSPKGTYATLALLQAAYPTGTTGVYLVAFDGHIYSWSGTAWTDRGQYQSTGIADSSIMPNQLSTTTYSNLNKFVTSTKTEDIGANLVYGADGTKSVAEINGHINDAYFKQTAGTFSVDTVNKTFNVPQHSSLGYMQYVVNAINDFAPGKKISMSVKVEQLPVGATVWYRFVDAASATIGSANNYLINIREGFFIAEDISVPIGTSTILLTIDNRFGATSSTMVFKDPTIQIGRYIFKMPKKILEADYMSDNMINSIKNYSSKFLSTVNDWSKTSLITVTDGTLKITGDTGVGMNHVNVALYKPIKNAESIEVEVTDVSRLPRVAFGYDVKNFLFVSLVSGSGYDVYKVEAGKLGASSCSNDAFTTVPAFAVGDKIRVTLKGQSLMLYRNGVLFSSCRVKTTVPLIRPRGKNLYAGIAFRDYATKYDVKNITIREKSHGKYIHFSIDDSIQWLKELSTSSYVSIFEHSGFAQLKSLHDAYGAVFTIELFYTDGTWDLSQMSTAYRLEFSRHAHWLKFGFHGLDGVVNYSTLTDTVLATTHYNNLVNAIRLFATGDN
jgi:hypothetical protein